MRRKNLKNDTDYPLIMTRELAAEFIGIVETLLINIIAMHIISQL